VGGWEVSSSTQRPRYSFQVVHVGVTLINIGSLMMGKENSV